VDKSESLTLPLIYSIAIHAVIAGVLLISFEFTPSTPEAMEVNLNQSDIEPAEEIVSAVSVDKAKVQEQVDRMTRQKAEAEAAEQRRIERLERRAEEARKAREREEQRQKEIERQQEIERQEAAQARKEAEQAKKEAQRLAEERAKAEAAAKEAERRKKEAEEAERRAAEERRKREEAERRAAEREAQLKKEMEEERARRQAARRQQVLSEVEKYQALIRQTIQRNWTVDDSMQGKSCELTISVAPSGFVKSVDTGNGDASVCRSARNAVLKANTLPVSEDPEIYQQMSTIKLTVKPQL